ncbi:hypothetical protein P67b_00067 [Ruegeria phage Tedan]|nr:hypothetical protein P67b_00067 [Ruegeria phage Tedan]
MSELAPLTEDEEADLAALDVHTALEQLWAEWPRQAAVAEAMAYSPSLSAAARIAQVPVDQVYKWKARYHLFRRALELMKPLYADKLRDTIHERGVLGYQKPVIYKGELQFQRDPKTGELMLDDDFEPIPLMETIVSDRLLERMADANLPEYANGRKGGVNVALGVEGGEGGAGGVKLEVNFVEPPDWDTVEWDDETGRPMLDVTPDE